MYKPIDKLQHSFLDFNQPLGLHMNPDNRWIKLADRIPWDTFAKSRKHKVKAPVEFGAKFDLSLDSEGYGRIEKISFEAYNESTCLIEAIERFRERTGYYPERVLADQIYRTRENRSIRIIPIESKWSAPSA